MRHTHKMSFHLLIVLFTIASVALAKPISDDGDSERVAASLARNLVHKANYGAFATISTLKDESAGYPMANVISIIDDAPTCDIYFMMTDYDITARDLRINNKLTMLVSDEQDLSCSSKGFDPMSFKCARSMLTGSMETVCNHLFLLEVVLFIQINIQFTVGSNDSRICTH